MVEGQVYLSPECPDRDWGPSVLLPSEYCEQIPCRLSILGVKLTACLQQVLGLKMHEAIRLALHKFFMTFYLRKQMDMFISLSLQSVSIHLMLCTISKINITLNNICVCVYCFSEWVTKPDQLLVVVILKHRCLL